MENRFGEREREREVRSEVVWGVGLGSACTSVHTYPGTVPVEREKTELKHPFFRERKIRNIKKCLKVLSLCRVDDQNMCPVATPPSIGLPAYVLGGSADLPDYQQIHRHYFA